MSPTLGKKSGKKKLTVVFVAIDNSQNTPGGSDAIYVQCQQNTYRLSTTVKYQP